LFGFREVEMLNKSYLTVIPEQNRLLCTDNFKRIKEGDSTDLGKMVEIKILNKNGKEILVDMLMWMWMDENKSFYSVIINTNRIEQQELAQRNIKIYQIGEEIDKSGIWHWDVVSDIVYYSEGFYNIFEVQTPTANSGTLLKSIYYQDRLMVEDTIRKAFADKQPYEINYRILSRDGHIKFLNCKAKPDLDEDGALRFLSGVIHELKIEKII
jgi:PAS domain-containing protein